MPACHTEADSCCWAFFFLALTSCGANKRTFMDLLKGRPQCHCNSRGASPQTLSSNPHLTCRPPDWITAQLLYLTFNTAILRIQELRPAGGLSSARGGASSTAGTSGLSGAGDWRKEQSLAFCRCKTHPGACLTSSSPTGPRASFEAQPQREPEGAAGSSPH